MTMDDTTGYRILVTGSADGLGRLAAEALLAQGHDVVVHARNARRAEALRPMVHRGARLVVADFAERDDVLGLATSLADDTPLDAVIHNAGVWSGPAVMPVNIIAPYLLTSLLHGPRRLVYLSSGSHYQGRPRRAGRSGTRSPDTDMARHERCRAGIEQRRLLVPPTASTATRLRVRQGLPGPPPAHAGRRDERPLPPSVAPRPRRRTGP